MVGRSVILTTRITLQGGGDGQVLTCSFKMEEVREVERERERERERESDEGMRERGSVCVL